VVEQAERVFHVDAHRRGQPAHVAQDAQDAQQREVAEELEKGRLMRPKVSANPKALSRAAAKADLSRGAQGRRARGRPRSVRPVPSAQLAGAMNTGACGSLQDGDACANCVDTCEASSPSRPTPLRPPPLAFRTD
jgi:hypothetical protein